MASQISLGTLIPPEKQSLFLKLGVKLLDKLMGLSRMQRLYEQHQMQNLSKEAFADKLLHVLNVIVEGEQEMLDKIPATGPVVIASNHPFGGLEGVILARAIAKKRPDLKVLANVGLQIFSELEDYFIFTNPLSERDPRNGPSLRTCMAQVKNGGALMLFPSGRVSYYRKEHKRIGEHEWNRIVAKLIDRGDANYVPVFVEGFNSNKFYRIGRIYYRLRMFMLGRELLNKTNQTIKLCAGNNVPAKHIRTAGDGNAQAALCRALSYGVAQHWQSAWPTIESSKFEPLAEQVSGDLILKEIAALPQEQHLVAYKDYDVYYGFQHQCPNIVTEIARLRELVFREHDEGSGQPIDTDKFDATYTQLFIANRTKGQIIGAYRMGQTDKLLENGGIENLYLSQMFDFQPSFISQTEPCLEMGRSFLVPEYQKSFYGLYLLWRGIGAFACKFPQYRRLYGTVSISKLYDKRSIAVMEKAMVKTRPDVKPKTPYNLPLHPELTDFDKQHDIKNNVTAFLKALEQDGKDVPVLLKHYMRLGAEFYCLGMDSSFADTPGLLLCVDLLNIPDKLAKQYLAEGLEGFRSYHAS